MRINISNKKLIDCVFFLPFWAGIVESLTGFKSIYYIADLMILLLMIRLVSIGKYRSSNIPKIIKFILFMLISVSCLNGVLKLQSITYFIWGFRNTFRGILFFLICVASLQNGNADAYYNFLKKIFYINFLFIIIEFFFFGIKGDFLQGIFSLGSNNATAMYLYMLIITSIVVSEYMINELKLLQLVLVLCILTLVAALAEFKLYFVVLPIIILFATVMNRSVKKTVLLCGAASIIAIAGVVILIGLFPKWNNYFSIEQIYNSSTSKRGYTSYGDFNRLTFISMANELTNGVGQRVLGLGLGNCDYSAASDLITSPFYKEYGELHYQWFSTAITYLENGYVGLVLNVAFFIAVCLSCMINDYKCVHKNKVHQIGFFSGLIGLITFFYDRSLSASGSLMLFLLMALPFCKDKKSKSEEKI